MLQTRFICVALCALAACENARAGSETQAARHHNPDAAVVSSPDASTATGNTVTCYSEGDPTATCTLPVHCCFTDYSSFHDGTCTTEACAWGTISCDGPEDCASGQSCCANTLYDAAGDIAGVAVACTSSTCETEICHTTSDCSSGTCVTAYGNDNSLPRALNICQ
jgi:hypothetical protein